MSDLLETRGLTVELPTPSGWVRPVNEVSLHIAEGESLGLVGESGSGKTMLSLALMGLLPPGARVSGEATLAAHASRKRLMALSEREWRDVRGGEIAMIFQEPMISLNPVMRIGAQIEEAIRAHRPKLSANEVKRKLIDALRRAAIPEPESRAQQFPHQLSGGLRQRAMIAMALAAGPRVLIADEPTTALDVTVQKQILHLLDRLRRELRRPRAPSAHETEASLHTRPAESLSNAEAWRIDSNPRRCSATDGSATGLRLRTALRTSPLRLRHRSACSPGG